MNNKTRTRYLAILVVCILMLPSLGVFVGCDLLLSQAQPRLKEIQATYNGQDLFVGQQLDKKDVEVTAHYTNANSKKVTDFQVGALDTSTAGSKNVTISYTEGSITRTDTITVGVIAVEPIRIEATYSGGVIEVNTQPDKTLLAVTAYYNNGDSHPVTNFATGPLDTSTPGKKNWQISYSEDGVTVSTTVKISVKDGDDYGTDVADMSIHFMELGYNSNGDSIYIKAGDTDILIDAGSEKGSAKYITQYVDQYCTDGKLEYVITTHADSDHINAYIGTSSATGILDYYECETIIKFARTGKSTTILGQYNAKIEELQGKGTNVYTALDCVKEEKGAQKVYEIAEGITMEILYQKYYETSTSNENDYSVCVMFTQGENHYIFLGDLEENGEKSLVQENPELPTVELYKAGHHGSKTSANEVLLNVIRPQYVCVSCVAGNVEYLTTGTQELKNAFPTQDFINRIAPYTDKVYVTSQTTIKKNANGRWQNDTLSSMNGNIVFSCINGVIDITCSNNNTLLKDTQWFKDYRDCPTAWL